MSKCPPSAWTHASQRRLIQPLTEIRCLGTVSTSATSVRLIRRRDPRFAWHELREHLALSGNTQHVHASWHCLLPSHYEAPFQTHVSKGVSDLDNDADILSMRQISIVKTTQEMQVCIPNVSIRRYLVVAICLLPVLRSEFYNCASTICTYTDCQS
jgi:hypothetical protein